MAEDMSYLTREKLSVRTQQALTSYDWDFKIDFTNYVGYHPDMETIQLRATDLTNVNPTLTTSVLEVKMRGYTLIQPGMTDNHVNATFGINLQDFEDQSLKAWFLDWQNKMDSLTTHKSYRREDLMVDCYVWRLNSDRQKVWEMHYINCLPRETSWVDDYNSDKQAVGKSTITIIAETVIPTPLNLQSAT